MSISVTAKPGLFTCTASSLAVFNVTPSGAQITTLRGKGIRMIIDYLREEKQDAVRAILDEKPAFTTGMEKFEMDVHDQQLDFLSDDLGIKMNDSEDAVERYAVRIQTAGQQPAMRADAAVGGVRSHSGRWRGHAWTGRCGWRRRGRTRTTTSTRQSAASTAEPMASCSNARAGRVANVINTRVIRYVAARSR